MTILLVIKPIGSTHLDAGELGSFGKSLLVLHSRTARIHPSYGISFFAFKALQRALKLGFIERWWLGR